jgi:hypothetical protein
MAGRGLHKEIRKAIAEAEQAGLRVVTFSGHTWGQVECPCGQHIKIYSTGGTPSSAPSSSTGSSAGTATTGARHDL